MQVILGVVEQSSALGMALYSICQHSIHNIELCHGCYAIFIVYKFMVCLIMSYAKDMVRQNDTSTNVDSLCFHYKVFTLMQGELWVAICPI